MKNILVILFIATGSIQAFALSGVKDLFATDTSLLLIMEQLKIPLRPEWRADGPTTVPDKNPGRIVQKYTLYPENLGAVNLAISFPQSYLADQDQRYPVLILLGGMQTGHEIIDLIHTPGNNVIVGFEYPIALPDTPKQAQSSLRRALTTPINISMLINWVYEQTWVDRRRINVMGVSFGAFMLPMSLRFSQLTGVYPRTAVLAYGGADLRHFAETSLNNDWSQKDRDSFVDILSIITDVYDPRTHLPQVRDTHFLVVNGTQDDVIPTASINELNEIVPNPKDVLEIPGPHIGTDRPEIVQALVTTVYEWLVSQGAIN
ncbi:MAG: prolyl oligopeptidase family serine peptidase [Pseudobdellovibrionaceae bacterium]|nr:prolyl oligopeptidase family serine peptidase [Bdellovibrionales bacterium]USN48728.1 MAG: prolyl oligopeptidase family serine peptidase [Pseudobdellovibrionaceae bacterium]